MWCVPAGTAQQHGKALNADDHTDALQKKQSDVENDPGAVNAPVGQAPSETLAREVSPAKGEVSDYEQARQQRMQANFEKLRSLGLSGGVADVIGAPAPPKKRPSKRKTAQDHAEGAPLRRSTRSTSTFHDLSLSCTMYTSIWLVMHDHISSLQGFLVVHQLRMVAQPVHPLLHHAA